MNAYIIIFTFIRVIIPYHIVDYYMNTIDDKQNEKDFFYHCKKFEYNHDFVKFLVEFFYDTLEFDVLNINISLYLIYYYKNFFWFVYLNKYETSFSCCS